MHALFISKHAMLSHDFLEFEVINICYGDFSTI